MDEIVRIAKGVYQNIGILAAEFADIPRLNPKRIHDFMEIQGLENYAKAKAKNKGVILITAHFGNWELMAAIFPFVGEPFTILYRPFDNALLENFVSWVRTSTGNSVMRAEHAGRRIMRLLRDKRTVGMLIDQNWAREEGCFVRFFNRLACTTTGLANIVLYEGVPVLPAFLVRKEDGRYVLRMGPEIKVIKTGDDERDIIANTQRYTDVIEEIVRKHPDQWFWVHQRWKTKPLPGETLKA